MCLYIVDNVSTCHIIYFRYVDMEKRIDNSPNLTPLQYFGIVTQVTIIGQSVSQIFTFWTNGELSCINVVLSILLVFYRFHIAMQKFWQDFDLLTT